MSTECWSEDFIQLNGKHITLTTDIDDLANNADLIAAFDAAVGQWESFWQLPSGSLQDFKVDACVMADKQRFQLDGRIPLSVPDFPFGFALQDRVWVVAQKSQYYTRHLLLHEGVHSLAYHQFGGTGPSWFMEGTAEMLAVHRHFGSDTKINQLPKDRASVPYWGRFKVMDQSRDANTIPSLGSVLGYPRDLQSDVESYGWSWAATMLLYQYPDTRDAFFASAKTPAPNDAVFNNDLKRRLQNTWPVVTARWRLMCHDIDYGFDWSREQVSLSMNDQVWDGKPLKLDIKANQGWQSIGVRLSPGMKLSVTPAGNCTLADQPKPWLSYPSGITLRYHRGRPLGQLLACLLPDTPDQDQATKTNLRPLQVAAITRPSQIPIKENCWLLFRINDVTGELSDNQGGYQLTIDSASK
ncbi:hypothetical protein K239x_40770 [Planctomycetes bacterium K23_9]|uniref:DUF1570 domain-containing protein n=1 Tax=Stieleria marina TaxID=1930275 RepID=A0A517NY80_9BACT|nr:hypothetical protein K239x_40770 [Planctomycetes bacterium K23_9]